MVSFNVSVILLTWTISYASAVAEFLIKRHTTKHNCNTINVNTTRKTSTRTLSTSHPQPTKSANATSNDPSYQIIDQYAGADFFSDWEFFTFPDPTNGMVTYVNREVAKSSQMAYVDNGVAFIKVDSTSNLTLGQPRKSVRIYSKKKYDGGLFIADIKRMPYGPATWPAFWTVGDNWPNNGEIDIIEGVNDSDQNQYTLHTAMGCMLDNSSTAPSKYRVDPAASTVSYVKCGSTPASNNGCAFIDSSKSSYGASLNAEGGAVFAMEWTTEGIKIWRFPRSSIPQDLKTQTPDPSAWPKQYLKAAWGSYSCDTKTYFNQHVLTFDTTLCGDWAGTAFPGGTAQCEQYVMTGSHFKDAVWAVNSVTVYQL